MAILARSSTELFEDSAPDLGEFLTAEVAYSFATLEDDCGFNGDGTSGFGGIAGLSTKLTDCKSAVTAAVGHNTFGTLDQTDLGSLIAAVLATAIATGPAWYTSATGFALGFCRLAAGGGGGYMESRIVDGVSTPFYLGFPVRFSGKLPDIATTLTGKPMLYFGNLAMSSVLVERQ
jgi:HK97 family phage major capsid protein